MMPQHRAELVRLLLALLSQSVYRSPGEGGNPWLGSLTSPLNRHSLPLFTSLLNTVCGYQVTHRRIS